ncbi:MAG: hypothetical protein A4E57_02716 [Syntrophorhabdaceae bacterium PtaU1.Bin034]|nr:MAG: hypothetical protein A4E57_02716 [Syntrophorhabdaceae bacterium PtaU1.Bin034]
MDLSIQKTEVLKLPPLVEIRLDSALQPLLEISVHVLHGSAVAGKSLHLFIVVKGHGRQPLLHQQRVEKTSAHPPV